MIDTFPIHINRDTQSRHLDSGTLHYTHIPVSRVYVSLHVQKLKICTFPYTYLSTNPFFFFFFSSCMLILFTGLWEPMRVSCGTIVTPVRNIKRLALPRRLGLLRAVKRGAHQFPCSYTDKDELQSMRRAPKDVILLFFLFLFFLFQS